MRVHSFRFWGFSKFFMSRSSQSYSIQKALTRPSVVRVSAQEVARFMPEPRTGKRGQKMRSNNAFKVDIDRTQHLREEFFDEL